MIQCLNYSNLQYKSLNAAGPEWLLDSRNLQFEYLARCVATRKTASARSDRSCRP